MLSDYIFSSSDVQNLFSNKCIIVIGDSVMRSIYKDLVLMLQSSRTLTQEELRRRGEESFMGDELIEGGSKGRMTNGKDYREVRQFQRPRHLVRFYFITRVYNSYVETVLADLTRDPVPDVIIMNSCLWDITRYGPNSMTHYKENLQRFCYYLNQVIPRETLVIWTTAMPVSNAIRGGFLLDHINFLSDILRLDQLLANFFASQVISDFKFDVVDLHFVFRKRTWRRKPDGIHWDEDVHRAITAILVTHICKAWNVQIPDRCQYLRLRKNDDKVESTPLSPVNNSPDKEENNSRPDSRAYSVSYPLYHHRA